MQLKALPFPRWSLREGFPNQRRSRDTISVLKVFFMSTPPLLALLLQAPLACREKTKYCFPGFAYNS